MALTFLQIASAESCPCVCSNIIRLGCKLSPYHPHFSSCSQPRAVSALPPPQLQTDTIAYPRFHVLPS
ncbi:unnamed protein product [Chondrus crispus]|uniref:Uncharacterized protein n=1 Tax=Chondrus crispus TaxID=2769 RepID=R7Q877_CHOCR|nr:unnamed protein product [Chondrus crispus]CDF33690.1 unnamed protein product [Chondrus crispus]|eukprot:XP_005713509.1 unnamed protein product [Chondrus crispus]